MAINRQLTTYIPLVPEDTALRTVLRAHCGVAKPRRGLGPAYVLRLALHPVILALKYSIFRYEGYISFVPEGYIYPSGTKGINISPALQLSSCKTSSAVALVRATVSLALLSALIGCSSVTSLLSGDSIDYKSASASQTNNPLDVPPDLTRLPRETRYSLPETQSTTTFSTYTADRSDRKVVSSDNVLPQRPDMRVERQGDQRWLVVNRPAQELYPIVRTFWMDLGFVLHEDLPEVGVMETDWAENRAKIPQDFIRNTLGKVLDSVYSTGERDKFRIRLERVGNDSTEIYISHRGMQEELVGSAKDQTRWVPRPSDENLEAEFLRRLMVRLGSDFDQAKAAVASAAIKTVPAKSRLIGPERAPTAFELDEPFDRAWRRVGLSLDRLGFTVEDRDRSQGLYFVRYVDSQLDASRKDEKSFMSRLFSFGSKDKPKEQPRYRIAIKQNPSELKSTITVLNQEGQPENSPIASKILVLLNEQLK